MGSQAKIPKVAIITRTKDRPLLLERAIKCVQNQSMRDFVHVVLNDGGDKTVVEKILKKYADTSRTVIIHNDKTRGADRILNQAVKSVESKYVAILDDDDTWHKDFLKLTTEHLENTGAMGVVTRTDRIEEDIVNNKIVVKHRGPWLPNIHEVNLYKQCLDMIAVTVAFVYRRSIYAQIGHYDDKMPVSADWEFTIRFLLKYDIDFIDHKPALANYHHRSKIRGANGNSVFYQRYLHDYYVNKIRNKYLREDIKQGRLGIGYIMNSLQYQREIMDSQKRRNEEQTVRIEGHINYALAKTEEKLTQKLNRNLSEVISRLVGVRAYRKAKKLLKRD